VCFPLRVGGGLCHGGGFCFLCCVGRLLVVLYVLACLVAFTGGCAHRGALSGRVGRFLSYVFCGVVLRCLCAGDIARLFRDPADGVGWFVFSFVGI